MNHLRLIICLGFCLGMSFHQFAQEVALSLTVLDNRMRPLAHSPVTLTEVIDRTTLRAETDAEGKAQFHITSGAIWQIGVLEMEHLPSWRVKVPPRGTYRLRRTLTYDPAHYERLSQAPVDRSKLALQRERQQHHLNVRPSKTHGVVHVKLKRKNQQPAPDVPVRLVCYKLGVMYESMTSAQGVASFLVPHQQAYQIDLEDIENYSYVDLFQPFPGISRRTFVFEPRNFTEIHQGDTVFQQLPSPPHPTSARHLVEVTFRVRGQGPLAEQLVCLKPVHGSAIYAATTNSQGIASFLLPKGHAYLYPKFSLGDLETYEEVIDLSYATGIGSSRRQVVLDPLEVAPDTPLSLGIPQDLNAWKQFFAPLNLNLQHVANRSTPYFAKNHLVYEDPDTAIGIPRGWLMTTGSVYESLGPNDRPSASRANGLYPMKDVPAALAHGQARAYDPCVLEFTLQPQFAELLIEYVFASEEYPEYLSFDDAFGIFVKGPGFDASTNLALLPQDEDRVSVSNVNHQQHAHYYWPNDQASKPSYQHWQYDGFTQKFVKRLKVKPGQTYTLTFVIFDRKDAIFDSGVFVGMRSQAPTP